MTNIHTTDDLLAMSDERFELAITEDLQATTRYKSPFQAESVIERTLLALIEKLWYTESQMERQAEDPAYPVERYQRTLGFRRHVLSAIDITERRLSFYSPRTNREVSAWKTILHEVCDELVGTTQERILDEFEIPAVADGITLRTWREIRNVKDPSRVVPVKEVAA